jgi:hypothetical protein
MITTGYLQAEKWHPFPFEIAYYGKRANLHPANTGYLVDALYLNKNIVTGGQTIRYRDSLFFPIPELRLQGGISLNVGQLILEENGTTIQISGSPNGIFRALHGICNYSQMHPGGNPLGTGSEVQSVASITHFGINDSIAEVTGPDFSISWSKKLGIIRFNSSQDSLTWVGTKDLGIGFQDKPLRLKMPSVGDIFHFRISKSGSYACNGPLGPIFGGLNEYLESRITITGVGPGNDFQVDEIISSPGSATGVLYQKSYYPFQSDYGFWNNSLEDSISPIGCDPNFLTTGLAYPNIGWLSDSGVSFTILCHEYIDLSPAYYFTSCVKAPFSNRTAFFPFNFIGFCTGTPLVADYFPVYLQSQGNCTSGTPLPDVLVTSRQKLTGKNPIYLHPQPAKDAIWLEGADQGFLRIFNGSGQSILAQEVGNGPVSVRHLPNGIYFYTLQTPAGDWAQGKWIKE